MKKQILAVLTAFALTVTIGNTSAAKTYKSTKDVDKVSKQLYKTNIKSYRDKTKTLILNKKTYNKLKKFGKWKKLSGIKAMKSYVKKKYPDIPSSKIQAKCKFSVNYKKKENSGRYKVTLTISDELAREWWMDTHSEEDDFDYKDDLTEDDYAPFPTPAPETPIETPETPTETPQKPSQTSIEEAIEDLSYLVSDKADSDGWIIPDKSQATEIVRQVQDRIDKYESMFNCKANDFEKAAIVTGWVDEHVDYSSEREGEGDLLAGTLLATCGTFECLNEYIGRCFGLDVGHCQGGNHIWNILTVNGVRYEYDGTDVGVDGMAFFEISHGQQAEYNVEKYGGKVAKISGHDLEVAMTRYLREQGYECYYIRGARTPEYTLRDVHVPGKYYYAVNQFAVSDTIKSKPDIHFGYSTITTPALSDDELIQYTDDNWLAN